MTGDSAREQKNYARAAQDNHYVNLTKRVSKISKLENIEITFTEKEALKVIHPHNDALVVSLKVANNLVHRVLVDNGSSVDILFKSALAKMNLEGAKLKPVKTSLYDFAGKRVDAEGIITLHLTLEKLRGRY